MLVTFYQVYIFSLYRNIHFFFLLLPLDCISHSKVLSLFQTIDIFFCVGCGDTCSVNSLVHRGKRVVCVPELETNLDNLIKIIIVSP